MLKLVIKLYNFQRENIKSNQTCRENSLEALASGPRERRKKQVQK